MGTTSETVKVTPMCRYGHGPLGRIRLLNHEEHPRGMVLPTYLEIPGMGPALMDGNGFSVTLFRCSTCGYLELFDDEVANG
jgi:hypothetical protein